MARLQVNRMIGSRVAVPVNILMPKLVYGDLGQTFNMLIRITIDDRPVQDATLKATLYSKDGLIEEASSTYVTNGIYNFQFTDKETKHGLIQVEAQPPYQGKAFTTLIRSIVNSQLKLHDTKITAMIA